MQIKKITLLSILATFLLICSLSTINAANNTISDTDTGGIAQGIVDTGDGDTLTLNSGTYNKINKDTNITISKNITIQGNGPKNNVIIDAGKLSRIFAMGNNTNVTFINITFINGNSSTSGGAFYNGLNGYITVINCNFINNNAINNGGAISINSGHLNLHNCNFNNNTGSRGAAVHSGALTFVYSSNFTDNSAISYSGDCYGGAINIINSYDSIIFESNFINNAVEAISSHGGGAIFTTRSNVNVSYCNFINNNAINGGAIINNPGANTTVSYCNFINNNATINGGVIYNLGNISVSGNIMSSNIAVLGQMIYNNGTMGILNLSYLSNSTVKTSKGSTVTLYATLTDDMGNTVTGQNISFYVDGVFIGNVTSIEGKANITYLVTTDPVAVLLVTGDYAGHEEYSINIKNGQLEIPKRDIIVVITIEENEDGSVTITANATYKDDGSPAINHPVEFYLDDELVGTGTTDENGIATLTIPANKITNGTHTIKVIVKGNNTTNNGISSTEFTITPEEEPETDPEEDPVTDPEEITENTTNENNNIISTSAAMKETGIPIIAALLILLASVGIVIRKKE